MLRKWFFLKKVSLSLPVCYCGMLLNVHGCSLSFCNGVKQLRIVKRLLFRIVSWLSKVDTTTANNFSSIKRFEKPELLRIKLEKDFQCRFSEVSLIKDQQKTFLILNFI